MAEKKTAKKTTKPKKEKLEVIEEGVVHTQETLDEITNGKGDDE